METFVAALRSLSSPDAKSSVTPSMLCVFVGVLYLAVILAVEQQWIIFSLVAAGALTVSAAARLGWIAAVKDSYRANETTIDVSAIAGVVVLTGLFATNHFVLLIIATVLVYSIACLGLNVQFGYAGMLNFAGSAMLAIGAYTAAWLGTYAWFPSIAVIPAGGVAAALVGSVLLPPMLRTQGHYSAVVTIAFSLLLATFLDVFPGFGGAQGLPVPGLAAFGWNFGSNFGLGGATIAFYVNYVALGLVLVVAVGFISRRLERSWIGLDLDAVRLDETASKCFGIRVNSLKAFAFTLGNFIAGLAGALYALLVGYIAPANFTFGDSLILVTIILLGGLGSIWGIVLAAAAIIILPEKLQVIQEYRFLIYAIFVGITVLFKPEGLVPRAQRRYFNGATD
jgi:ABC-type branched-subunit amino acid transport system permease subunit